MKVTVALLVLFVSVTNAADHGSGCEKKLDKVCPNWRANPKDCLQCIQTNLHKLEPECTQKKADSKCGATPSPPGPGPTPPATPPVAPPPLPPKPAAPPADKPNIVMVLTDDQDLQLGSMDAMSFTRALGQKGANFSNFFAHTPVCCPSRSELLTGRYFHNLKNDGFQPDGCMHINTTTGSRTGNPLTFAAAVSKAGYATGYFGKYLNEGGMQDICGPNKEQLQVPEGWREFLGACPDTCYTDCNYNLNGASTWFTNASSTRGSNYGTSVIGNASVDFAQRAMAANWPFMLVVASHAPHGPATPAPWYADLYSTPDVIAPRTPSFGVSSHDKHWIVATQPKLTQSYIEKKIDNFYKNRMRALRSVDDVVAGLHDAVAQAGQLDRTYFIFTSDHGLHMGQFCLGPCKRQPYETDIRIPMLLVGPSVPAASITAVAGLVDLAPTILQLTSSPAASTPMDGRSLVPLFKSDISQAASTPWRDTYLIEYAATSGAPKSKDIAHHLKDCSNNTFIGIRVLNSTHDLAFFEFTDAITDWAFKQPDFCEMYDLKRDPHQLTNVCSTVDPQVRQVLREKLYELYACKGSTCV